MKKKVGIVLAVLAILLVLTGVVVYQVVIKPKPDVPVVEEAPKEELPAMDASITVNLIKSKLKDNTVILSATGLAGKIASVAYELTYESEGLIKGVNSGSKPIDIAGKDSFEREVYMGTCSRNVCKPDAGVKKVSVVLEFTDTAGKKSQFSKDYDL